MKEFYGQHAEDYFLYEILSRRQSGFYVEVGCIDGARFSNSLFFEKMGWRGICIEAHPGFYKMMTRKRPKATNLNYAIAESDKEEITFHASSRGTFSTLDIETKKKFLKHNEKKYDLKYEKITVKQRKLDTIFREHKVGKIDFISIDIEGAEQLALDGFQDVSLYNPSILLIECNLKEEKQMMGWMELHNFERLFRVKGNVFFVNKERVGIAKGIRKHQIVLNHSRHPNDKISRRFKTNIELDIDSGRIQYEECQ